MIFIMPDITIIMAIDPGPEKSAWVIYNPDAQSIVDCSWMDNHKIIEAVARKRIVANNLAIEMISHYGTGMHVGREVFETCLWIGRFIQLWHPRTTQLIMRSTIKTFICGQASAKDKNVRQALLDRFPRIGGGATPQVGTKLKPGPLFGIPGEGGHKWSALALAVAWAEQQDKSK